MKANATSGSKHYSCRPWFSETEWVHFIDALSSHSIPFSVAMTARILEHRNNSKCTVHRYQQRWRGRRVADSLPPHCRFAESGLTRCYLMEKGPVPHLWSCYHAFGRIMDSERRAFETDRRRIESYILQRVNGSQSFQSLRAMAIEVNSAWNALSKGARHREMMRLWYPRLMACYLRLRFVAPRDILVTLRLDAFLWFPLSAVNVLFWVYCYDEMGHSEQFRMVQFESVFDDIQEASRRIQCWLRDSPSDCVFRRDAATKNTHSLDEGPTAKLVATLHLEVPPAAIVLI